MQAHRFKVTIPPDHDLVVKLPEEVPAGPAELIVLVEAGITSLERSAASTVEAARARWRALAQRLATDGRPFRGLPAAERRARLEEVKGIGRGLLSASDEFARLKLQEIEVEERHLGR